MTLEEQIYRAEVESKKANDRLARLMKQKYDIEKGPDFSYGGEYSFISGDGQIVETFWDGDVIDQRMLEIGNIFRTEAEAELARDRRKVEAILQRMTKGFVPDWEDVEMDKFSIAYNHGAKSFAIHSWSLFELLGSELFGTEEDVKAAIAEVGEEELKRVYGVKW